MGVATVVALGGMGAEETDGKIGVTTVVVAEGIETEVGPVEAMGLAVLVVLVVVTLVWACVIMLSFATGAAGGVVETGE